MEIICQLIDSEELLKIGRLQSSFFSRNRVLSFKKLILFIINLIKKTLQLELDNFTKSAGVRNVSKQAFSKARLKLNPIVFKILNKKLISETYTDNEFKTKFGFRILAVDGTKIQLPSSKEILDCYGVSSNQYGASLPMAKGSVLFDALNKITIDAQIESHATSEKNLAITHFHNLLKMNKEINFGQNNIKDLIILDRGYPSTHLISIFDDYKIDYLMRCPSVFLKEVNNTSRINKVDQIIEIKFKNLNRNVQAKLKQDIENFDKNRVIKIRVLTTRLRSGEKEILLTSLLDQQKYKPIDLFDLYNKRWDIEENYKFYKTTAAMENFSGKSKIAIEQDFHATVFTTNIANLLMQEAQDEINEVLEEKDLKYKYKINKNIALGTLKNQLIEALFSNQNIEGFCEKIKLRMQQSLVPIRPGRSFPRHKSFRRKYASNRKSCL